MAATQAPILLQLYGRAYCHLCEEMQVELERLAGQLPFELEVVDVDSSEALERRYGDKVPLLAHGESEICHYFLDQAALARYLQPWLEQPGGAS